MTAGSEWIQEGTEGAPSGPAFSFRIGRRLEYFDREYDPADPSHRLLLRLNSGADLERFAQRVFSEHINRPCTHPARVAAP